MSQRELLQLLHTPLADTLLVAERLNDNVARINIAVAQTARQDLERQAQPANPLEATTGEATTGAGAAPTGGAPAGTAMPIEDGVAVRWPAVRCGAVRWPAGRPARRPPEPPARGRPRVGVEVWCRGVEARAQQGPRDSPLV